MDADSQSPTRGAFQAVCRVMHAEVSEKERTGEERRGGVRDAGTRDIRRAAVNGFKEATARSDIRGSDHTEASDMRRCEIGEDVSEEIRRYDDIECFRVLCEPECGGIDEQLTR